MTFSFTTFLIKAFPGATTFRAITYIRCKATKEQKPLQGQKYHTPSSHLLFLNNISALCPQRFVAQLTINSGVWDSFYSFYFTVAFAFDQQQKVSTATAQQEGISFLTTTATPTALSPLQKVWPSEINPNLAHPPKLPPLHYVDINPRTTGHSQRYGLGKFLQLPQSCDAPEPTS